MATFCGQNNNFKRDLFKTKYLTYNIKTKAKNITFKRLFLQKGVVNLH